MIALKKALIVLTVILLLSSAAVFAEELSLETATASPGNIFFDGYEQTFEVSLSNGGETERNLQICYSIYNKNDQTEVQIAQKDVTVDAGSVYQDTLTLSEGLDYGLYYLKVRVKQSGEEVLSRDVPFSVCVFVPESKINNKMGISAHFNWGRDSEMGLRIIKSIGIGNIREGYSWSTFEAEKGVYEETHSNTEYLSNAGKNNIDVLVMAGYSNSLYADTGFDFPATEDQREAFAEYVFKMLENGDNADTIKYIEVWNEPDLNPESGNERYATPEEYAYLLKTVYEKVKPAFPDVKIGAPSLAKTLGGSDTSGALLTGQAWLKRFLEQDFDGDGEYDTYKYFDTVMLHQYDLNYNNAVENLKKVRTILTEHNCGDKEIYHTEFGISAARNGSNEGDVIQAERLSRYYLTLLANDCADQYYIYDFSNDGFDLTEREDNFGLCENHQAEVPYAAKKGLLAIAALNYLAAGMDEVESFESGSQTGAYAVKLKMSDKEDNKFYAFYSNSLNLDDTEEYLFETSSPNIKFYDFIGNRIYPEATENGYKITIGSQPVYATETNDPAGEIEYIKTQRHSDKTVVSGKIKDADYNDMIGIKIFDSDGVLCDIKQLTADEYGKFQFDFYPKAAGSYTIRIGTMVLGKAEERIFTWSSESMVVTAVLDNDSFIDTFEQYLQSDNLKITVKAEDLSYSDFDLVVGYFCGDSLLKCEIISKEQMIFCDNIYSCDANRDIPGGTDSIRIMTVDDLNNIKPLYDYLIID